METSAGRVWGGAKILRNRAEPSVPFAFSCLMDHGLVRFRLTLVLLLALLRPASAYLQDLAAGGVRPLPESHADSRYVSQLVAAIRPRMRRAARYRRIRVVVLDSPRTDARAFPGGTVLVHRGLLDFAGSEAALVGVLGHELSHIDHGHQLRQMKMAQLARKSNRTAAAFLQDGLQLGRSFLRPFRPEDEAAADADGAQWAFDLGYDPDALADMFLRMHRRDQSDQRAGQVPSFLRSHPYHIDRYRALQKQSQRLRLEQPQKSLRVGAENLKQRKMQPLLPAESGA